MGTDFGFLFKNPEEDSKYYCDYYSTGTDSEPWMKIPIVPVDVVNAVTHEFARQASGIKNGYAEFSGVIGGVGALGATLVEIWSKESWGNWTVIDDDILRSHNVIRHIAKEYHVGRLKTDIVSGIASNNYWPGYAKLKPINGRIESQKNEEVKNTLSSADFLVDATTTLYAPRDLAVLDSTPRMVSVFLTPSGRSSVLLIEDANRMIRVDQLEAQYYRTLINNSVGNDHLKGHQGNIIVGAGCRDISVVMPFEDILLHSANLAKQIRLLRDMGSAAIRIWTHEQQLGDMACLDVTIFNGIITHCNNWRVIYDDGLQQKLKASRQATIPNETGGVIVGYIDQKMKSIYIVDILNAPADSKSSVTGFTRGIKGLKESLDDISDRTAHIVQYVGEWHSHPPFSSPQPSRTDNELIESLATSLASDGLPALMIIVGRDGELSLSVKQYD